MLKPSHKYKKRIFPPLLILMLAVIIFISLESFDVINFFGHKSPYTGSENSDVQTTSKAATAQSGFTDGETRSTSTNTAPEGTVSDTRGTIANLPPASQWATSGLLTVYTPAQSSILHSGDTLSGTYSGSGRVSFRLIDSVSGVISQGALAVVDGKYSGTFNFTTKAAEGRVDVFSQAADGTESNNVSIPVRFK